jgi:hypothetical protein
VTGKYNICYLNAFQTQPGEANFWTGSHSDLLLKNSKGRYVTDPGWPGEYLLNTSTLAKRTAIAGIVNGWIDGCAHQHFQAIEPDNLDSWTRSKKLLSKANNVALATLLASHAHKDGLAIAQKNTTELGSTGKTKIKFDFAIAEECQVYDECGSYTGPYGNRVIEIEYTDNARSAYTTACAARGSKISVILRDRGVVAKGKKGYHYEYCPPSAVSTGTADVMTPQVGTPVAKPQVAIPQVSTGPVASSQSAAVPAVHPRRAVKRLVTRPKKARRPVHHLARPTRRTHVGPCP